MKDSSLKSNVQHGFTLVELLVVLVILASLVTMATVSTETTQHKARADRTAAMGREVIEDLERSDYLSFVSDFGRLPENADELKFLFSQTVVDATNTGQEAAAYQFRLLELPAPPSGAPNGSAAKLGAVFGTPTLGTGWRGPYSLAAELQMVEDSPYLFLDGWKNEWEVLMDGPSFAGLRSPGRDGLPGGTDWQDADLEFPLRRNLVTENVDIQGQVVVRAADGTIYTSQGQFNDLTLVILYFTPEFAANFAANTTTGNVATVEFIWNGTSWTNPTRSEQAADDPFLFRLSGLIAGRRAVFVYAFGTPAGRSKALYGGGVQLVPIQPGTNRIEFMLTEL